MSARTVTVARAGAERRTVNHISEAAPGSSPSAMVTSSTDSTGASSSVTVTDAKAGSPTV